MRAQAGVRGCAFECVTVDRQALGQVVVKYVYIYIYIQGVKPRLKCRFLRNDLTDSFP